MEVSDIKASIERLKANPSIALDMTEAELVLVAKYLNDAYRKGAPLVSDGFYDSVVLDALYTLWPNNEYLQKPEAEQDDAFGKLPRVEHPRPMLSTDKAYTEDEVARYVKRTQKEAIEIGLDPSKITYRLTPKLDGIAGHDYGDSLATRGDGTSGRNISHIYDNGAVVFGGERVNGPGEIVVLEDYFQDHLKEQHGMSHPRNFIAGFCGADTLKKHHLDAVGAEAVIFYPYSKLPSKQVDSSNLLESWREYLDWSSKIGIRTDGLIVEVEDDKLRTHMGATSHHHRFMLAIKAVGEEKTTTVNSITWQTGRTGRITPVAELEPVEVSGAVIRRVTVHHAGMLANLKVGTGAKIAIVRSGEVVPRLTKVIGPAQPENCTIPHECPSCGHQTIMENDFLICPNTLHCSAQRSSSIQHFFKTLGNVDLFGSSTVDKLIESGFTTLRAIYDMSANDFERIGFGPKQSLNLVTEIGRSQKQEIFDWQFLAAFGIRNLGRGDSKRLLKHIPLSEIVSGKVSECRILAIKGFGEVTSKSIVTGIEEVRGEMAHLLPSFTIRLSGIADEGEQEVELEKPLSGQFIVFTGTMLKGARDDMKDDAEKKGATVQSSVNSKTTMLVCGEKVGAKKTEKAQSLGVKVLSEQEYLDLHI